jgi:hypothetical protein
MLVEHRIKAKNSRYSTYFVEFYLQLFLKFCILRMEVTHALYFASF